MYLPKLTKINKVIVIAMGLLFLFKSAVEMTSGINLAAYFGLIPGAIFQGHIYQLFTYPLFSQSIFEVIFDGLLFWFIGHDLEENWGRKRYLFYLGFSLIAGGLIYVLFSMVFFPVAMGHPLSGCSGLAASMCVVYGILYPTRVFTFMFVIPLQAKYFAWILVAMSLYAGLFTPGGAGAWGHLGTIAMGYVAMLIMSHPKWKMYFQENLTPPGPPGRGSVANKKGKAKLSLVKRDDGDDNDVPPTIFH